MAVGNPQMVESNLGVDATGSDKREYLKLAKKNRH